MFGFGKKKNSFTRRTLDVNVNIDEEKINSILEEQTEGFSEFLEEKRKKEKEEMIKKIKRKENHLKEEYSIGTEVFVRSRSNSSELGKIIQINGLCSKSISGMEKIYFLEVVIEVENGRMSPRYFIEKTINLIIKK